MSVTYRTSFYTERKFNSDKWEHYFEIYDHCLSNFYGQNVRYLEMGVQNGGSLEIARNLFGPKSLIVGMDIDPTCAKLKDDGIADSMIIGSQSDDESLKQLFEISDFFHVVIDDGSHIQFDMIQSFISIFPALVDGGVYIIEDTHTNFSPDHQASFHGIGLYDYFKGLAERLNLPYMDPARRQSRYKVPRETRTQSALPFGDQLLGNIFSIEFFDSVIAIRKRSRLEPYRIRL